MALLRIGLASLAAAVLTNGQTCQNIAAETENGICYRNVTWAMETGSVQQSQMYENYTDYGVNTTMARNDMQCVLWHMRHGMRPGETDESAGGHTCPKPCSTNFQALCPAPTPSPTAAPTVPPTPAPTEAEKSESMPWWAWLLLGIAIALLIIGIVGYFCMSEEKKKPAKKRALKKDPPPPPPAPAPQPQQVYVMTHQPVQTTAVPVQTAQPIHTVYGPPPMQPQYQMQPLQTQYATQQLISQYGSPRQVQYAQQQPMQMQYQPQPTQAAASILITAHAQPQSQSMPEAVRLHEGYSSLM